MADFIANRNSCESFLDPFDQVRERFNVRPLGREP